MKKSIVMVWLAILSLVLAACGSAGETSQEGAQLAYQPESINPETDVCAICAMAVADDRHATQIVLTNHRALKFDDLGCLFKWIEENGEDEVGAKFVRDYHTLEWVLLEEAVYVFDEKIQTPMAYGVISFKNAEDAQSFIQEHGSGELLRAEDLYEHKWQMMKHHHGHEHGDEQGHEDGHHQHAHAEGLEIHMAHPEHLTAGENTRLESRIALHGEALEKARVRYEIWKEGQDHKDWLDATESSPGTYVADHVFAEAGTYHIQVHVEDGRDLHEHIQVEVTVEEARW